MIIWGGAAESEFMNTGGKYNPGTNSWEATSAGNAPSGRNAHTAVWTGSEMIVWGGYDGSINLDTGGRYNPATGIWTSVNTGNAPSARIDHTAVWTGNEMIVWAGYDEFGASQTGGKYNPSTEHLDGDWHRQCTYCPILAYGNMDRR